MGSGMQEILPGVWHWNATHPNTGSVVSSYWVTISGTASGSRSATAARSSARSDSLLFAHGDPIVGGGKDALREFSQM